MFGEPARIRHLYTTVQSIALVRPVACRSLLVAGARAAEAGGHAHAVRRGANGRPAAGARRRRRPPAYLLTCALYPPHSPLCAAPLTTCPHLRTLLLHVLEFEAALLTVSLLLSPNAEFVQSLYYWSNIYYVSSNISTSVNEIVEITASACWWSECAQMCCAGRTRCNRNCLFAQCSRPRVCSLLCICQAQRAAL